MCSFLAQEIDAELLSMELDRVSGLDGWSVAFFHMFLNFLKGPLLVICTGFTVGMLDISRLKFGVLPLILKSRGLIKHLPISPDSADQRSF